MPNPTPEDVAAEVLERMACDDFDAEAAAVVAAVRPILAVAVTRELASILDDYGQAAAAELLRNLADNPAPGDAHYVEEAGR